MMSIIYIWISVLIIIENKSPIVNVYCEVTSFICSHCGPFTIRKDRPLLHKYVAIALQRNWLQCIISQMQTLLAVGDRLPEQRDECICTFLDALASLESVMRVTHNFFVRYRIKGFQTSDLKL